MSGLLAAAWLAFVRTARFAWFGVAAAIALVWLGGDAAPAAAGAVDGAARHALGGARFTQGFTVAATLSALALIAHVRHLVRLRSSEADGLLVVPLPRWAWAVGSWMGAVLAAGAALVAIAAVLVASGRGVGADHMFMHTIETPPLSLIGERDAREFVVPRDHVRTATRLRARLVALPDAGAVVFVSLAVRRTSDDGVMAASEWARSEARVWARRSLEVEVPPGDGAIAVRMARIGAGAGVGLERNGLAALRQTRLPFVAEARVLLAALCAVAFTAALAAALVPHLDLWLTVLACGTPWLVTFATGIAPTWLPGAELVSVLDLTATGVAGPLPRLVPTVLAVALWLTAAVLAPRFARESDLS